MRDIAQNVLHSSWQTSSSSHSYFQIFFLIAFLQQAYIRNIIILPFINYIIIITIYINSNDAVINKNYGGVQDLILLYKIPMDTQKNFFEIFRDFGHAPYKRFASHGLGCKRLVTSGRVDSGAVHVSRAVMQLSTVNKTIPSLTGKP